MTFAYLFIAFNHHSGKNFIWAFTWQFVLYLLIWLFMKIFGEFIVGLGNY